MGAWGEGGRGVGGKLPPVPPRLSVPLQPSVCTLQNYSFNYRLTQVL